MAITEHYVSSAGGATYANATSSSTPCTFALAIAGAVAGDRVNIQAGTSYTQGANLTFATNGTATSPIVFRGVDAAWAPIATSRTGGTGAIDTTNHPHLSFSSGYRWDLTGNYVVLENLRITGTYTGGLLNQGTTSGTGTFGVHRGVVVDNAGTGSGVYAVRLSPSCAYFLSDYTLSGAPTTGRVLDGNNNSATPRLFGCRVAASGSAYGIYAFGGYLYKTLVYASGNAAIYNSATTSGATLMLLGCTLADSGAQGVSVITGNTASQILVDTGITDCATYGVYSPDASCMILSANCRLDRNTTADMAGGADWLTIGGWGNVLTDQAKAAEYVAAGSRDYSLVAGAEGAGVGIYPYTDIGAIQNAGTGKTVISGGGGGGGSSGFSGVVAKATTSFICHFGLTSKTTGEPLTGLTSGAFAVAYMRAGAASATAATVNSIGTLGTYAGSATNCAIGQVSAANMPGTYEFHAPNNALGTGANRVKFEIRDAGSNDFLPTSIDIQLSDLNLNDPVRGGMTCLPNAVAGTTSGLPISSDLSDEAAFATALLTSPNAIEPGLTLASSLKLIGAATAGELTGAGTAAHAFKGVLNTSKTRIAMGTDIAGNRTPATYDLT